MLLYFGSTFASKKIDGKPRTAQAIDWNTVFTMVDGTHSKLSSLAKDFREEILADLQLIKFSRLSVSAVQNEFVRIPGSNVYIYQHKEYMQASSVEFKNIERACAKEIIEVHKPVFLCKRNEESHDDDLLPFFHSNPELTDIYTIISNNSDDEQRKAVIKNFLNCVAYVVLMIKDLIQTIICSVIVRTHGQNAFLWQLLPATMTIM